MYTCIRGSFFVTRVKEKVLDRENLEDIYSTRIKNGPLRCLAAQISSRQHKGFDTHIKSSHDLKAHRTLLPA